MITLKLSTNKIKLISAWKMILKEERNWSGKKEKYAGRVAGSQRRSEGRGDNRRIRIKIKMEEREKED